MTRTLILIRHAKSAWSDPTLDDYRRPLNARGERAATALGRWMAGRGLVPDEVLVSGAERTVRTWAGIAPELAGTPAMRTERALYQAGPDAILDVLHGATGDRVALIAHNPGIAAFAAKIAARPPDHLRFPDYPTGATTVLTFDTPWADVGWGDGTVTDFVVPRELE